MSQISNNKETMQPIIKQLEPELRQALYVCMTAGTDLHGDTVTNDEIRKACHSFNSTSMQANLFHKMHTDSIKFVESYVIPTDIQLEDVTGNIRTVTKGSWLVVTQTDSDEIWQAQKDGRINGVSIGALGRRETINEQESS
jgi:hypothetical protein